LKHLKDLDKEGLFDQYVGPVLNQLIPNWIS